MSLNVLGNFQHVLDYWLDRPAENDEPNSPLIVLGQTYKQNEQVEDIHSSDAELPASLYIEQFGSFIKKLNGRILSGDWSSEDDSASYPPWPKQFLQDVETRIWFTYRSGFPIIPRDPNGPSPVSVGSFFRGTLDLANASEGFTTDAGWGCMIRTSQSLLANAFLSYFVGRDWRYNPKALESNDDYNAKYNKQWEIVTWFADIPTAPFSIHQIVKFGSERFNKKSGEWFGPSTAAQSLAYLCDNFPDVCKMKTYLTEGNGDIYEDEFYQSCYRNKLLPGEFSPVLILSGIRLGITSINPIYWNFLKMILDLPESVGVAGGRPSSSHYFFGYQGDSLFYLDPHIPQQALLMNENTKTLQKKFLPTVHTNKIRKLPLSEMDPSMLIGILIGTEEDYLQFKSAISKFKDEERFFNIYAKRPSLCSQSSAGSELYDEDDFIDLGPIKSEGESHAKAEGDLTIINHSDADEKFEVVDNK